MGNAGGPRLLLWPVGGLAAVLLAALALAVANAQMGGSPVLAPGESLWKEATALVGAYAILINRGLRRLPGANWNRWVIVTMSALPAAAVLGLFVVPAINGLYGWGGTQVEERTVERLEWQTAARTRERQYWVWIASEQGSAVPGGRYRLGSYTRSWQQPSEGMDPSRVRVKHRKGLLGARTVLETAPVE